MTKQLRAEEFYTYHIQKTPTRGHRVRGGKMRIGVTVTAKMFEVIQKEAVERKLSVAAVIRELLYVALDEANFE